MNNSIIPQQNRGKGLDLEMHADCTSEAAAATLFEKAHNRLLRPVCWHELAGNLSARFQAENNEDVIKEGTMISISIPGPGTVAGDGYDWVIVKKITSNAVENYDESIAVLLQVSVNPEKPDAGIAHFFAGGATSTFIIARKKNKVIASYHGRNESPNTDNETLPDKIRNTTVALGALAGLSELQWKNLLKGLLS